MEIEAMYGGRDVACTMPRIFDRTSGSGRQSLFAGTIYGIASRPDSTGSVYGRTLKEIKDALFWRKRMGIV